MAPRKTKDTSVDVPSHLLRPKAEAKEKLAAQMGKGREMLSRQISTEADVDLLSADYHKWNDFNKELLRVLFSGSRVLEDYDRHRYVSFQ
jgi:hypothetical protein